MKCFYFYETPIGKITIYSNNDNITKLSLSVESIDEKFCYKESDVIKDAINQLMLYFSGKLRVFSIPLEMIGTDFTIKVWECLQKIPYGKTATYKEIAILSGHPNASRAVGLANSKNHIPIFIPCHRVIGSSGKLVGFNAGLHIKQQLLNLECNFI